MNNPLTKLIERRGEEYAKRKLQSNSICHYCNELTCIWCEERRDIAESFTAGCNDELILKAIRLQERTQVYIEVHNLLMREVGASSKPKEIADRITKLFNAHEAELAALLKEET